MTGDMGQNHTPPPHVGKEMLGFISLKFFA
jgi:hypothetical protein